MLCEEIIESKSSLSALCEPIKTYPQYLENVRVKNKAAVLSDGGVIAAKQAVEELIGNDGRVLLRKSGTEPLIRVMIECNSEERCKEYAGIIVNAITKGGHVVG